MSLDLSLDFRDFKISAVKPGGYTFGEYRLDSEKKMLYRGDTEIALSPKIVETLIVLVENQGEIVSKADLMGKVWPDATVEESNLSQHLYYLRKALADAGNGKPIIETLRRRGYRFNAKATVISAEPVHELPLTPRLPLQNVSVMRHGNVLTVADWEPTIQPATIPSTVGPVTGSAVNQSGHRPIIAYSAAAILTIGVMIAAFLLFQNRNNAATQYVGDAQFSFLTNGRPVEGLAISPDGNYFVYHELEAPIGRIWLQQTGQSGRTEIVPAAERNVGSKTFSPDGQFVYFVAAEKEEARSSLYRVPTLGGPYARILDNVSTPVTFSPDGSEMAFVRNDNEKKSSELVIASADGSSERVILKRQGGQLLQMGSAWSPDGRLIAFASLDMDDSGTRYTTISTVDLTTGDVAAISPEKWDTCYRMQWTADGRGLVFIGTRDGESLSSRRDQVYFLSYPDGRSRKLTSEGNRHDPISLGITATDAVMVLPFGRSSQIWAMETNGDSRTSVQITKGMLDGRAGLAPLPDGRIGYIARTGENVNVWIMNADGTDQRQLTSDPSFVEELRASPDGTFFVFSGVKDRRSHLYRIGTDGSGQTQISKGDADEVDSCISPDGMWVVYASAVFKGLHGKSFIWKVPSVGGQPEQLSPKECASPHVSPDGMLISCVTENYEIAILRFHDGAVLRTLRPRPLTRLNFGAPWTPDSRSLAYISLDGGTANLWLHPAEGGTPRQWTDFSGGDIYNFAFSNNGSHIFLARGNPVHDAMLIRNFK